MCEGSSNPRKTSKALTKSRGSFGGRCVKAASRGLRRARDIYVSSLGGCAGGGGGGAPMRGATAGMVAMMPRAQSSNTFRSSSRFGGREEDDFAELVRANSMQEPAPAKISAVAQVKRSQSMAPAMMIGRIDEDAPCQEFGDDGDAAIVGIPRSRSCAVMPAARRRTTNGNAGPA